MAVALIANGKIVSSEKEAWYVLKKANNTPILAKNVTFGTR
jgi:hypothetical protein